MTTKSAGNEGLVWTIGVVKDLDDPLQLGRVRAASIAYQDQIDASDLPWAHILLPPTSASQQQVGISPTGIALGSHVVMMFLDGKEKQMPLILGTLAKIPDMDTSKHDVSKLARGENSIKLKKIGPEPSSPYAAKYPFNKVLQTSSGHIIEIDDTDGAERLHIYHKSGTYIEMDAKGNRTDKIMNNHIDVTVKDKTIYVKGDCLIQTVGDCNIKTQGDCIVEAIGDCSVKAKNITIAADNININGNVAIDKGTLTHKGVNVGSDHVHSKVKTGTDKSGVPE